jgi:hypothetical protein
MNYNIKEEEEDNQQSLSREDQDIVLITKTPEDLNKAINALENIRNYGIYTQNLNLPGLKKAMEEFFGPSHPSTKKAAIKARGGEPFPIRTADSTLDFKLNYLKSLNMKPNILYWEKKNDSTLVFPKKSNETKDHAKAVIDTVITNYNKDKKEEEKITGYKIKKEYSSISENITMYEFRKLIREEIKNIITK